MKGYEVIKINYVNGYSFDVEIEKGSLGHDQNGDINYYTYIPRIGETCIINMNIVKSIERLYEIV